MSEEKERRRISPISAQTREAIRQRTAYGLPNNPSERGMSAAQIKEAFWLPVTGEDTSVLAELDRVASEVNAALEQVDGDVLGALERLLATGMTEVELADILERIRIGIGDGSLALNEVETNIAGCMGYYWKSIDTANRKIYLSREQITPSMEATDYTDETFETPAYAVGDSLAIVNNNKFYPEATITNVTHNVITYDGDIGFESIIPVDSAAYDVDDYSLFVPEKPDVGMVPIKRDAFAAGQKTRAIGNASAAINTDNEAYGDHGFAYNYGNRAAWAASAGGYGNQSNGFYSDTVGRENVNDAECGRVAGRGNTTTKDAYGADVSGNGNTVGSAYVHVAGKSNTINNGVQKSTGSSATGEENQILGALNSEISGKKNTIKGSNASNQYGGSQSSVGGLENELDGISTGATNVHMHGEKNKASHRNADVGGKCNRSSAVNQTVRGTYNKDNANALFIVGNGTDENHRANAFEVLNDGQAVMRSLKLGETVLDEMSLKNILSPPKTICGLYLFNETDLASHTEVYSCDVNFTCMGMTFKRLIVDMNDGNITYIAEDGEYFTAWYQGSWNAGGWHSHGGYRLIYFGAEPQEVPQDLYDYLNAHGKFTPAGNATFTMIENGADCYTIGEFPYEKGMTWDSYLGSDYNLDRSLLFEEAAGNLYWYIGDGGYSVYSAENRDWSDNGRPSEIVGQEYTYSTISYPYYWFSN